MVLNEPMHILMLASRLLFYLEKIVVEMRAPASWHVSSAATKQHSYRRLFRYKAVLSGFCVN